jgi:hypothetical protein
MLVFSCILFFLLSIVFELLLKLKRRKMDKLEELDKYNSITRSIHIDASGYFKPKNKLLITSIHVGVCFFIYLLMFAVMAYNGFLILSVILGNVVGYGIFGYSENKKSRDIKNVGCCHCG